MSCNVCRGYDSSNCPTCSVSFAQAICPECDGDGLDHSLAFNIRTRQTTEVSEMAWMLLPDTEDIAEARGWNYCKAEETCPFCKGQGMVFQDNHGNYFPML